MSPVDRIWMGLRYARGRLVESILVVAATAVGVSLVAAMVAFVQAYGEQTDTLLNHPAYRELLVEVVGNETELTEPAVAFDAATTRETRIGAADLGPAAEATPAVAYAYIADPTRFSTRLPGAGAVRAAAARMGGGGGAFEVAPPEGGPDGAASPGAGGESPPVDLGEFFAADPDVITELPLETFGGALVTGDFFSAYGLSADAGDLFTDDDVAAGNQVVVLGSALARKLFPDDDPIGLKVRLNLQTLTIVGVLAPSGLSDVDTGIDFDELAFAPNGEAQISFGGRTVRFSRPTRTLRFAVSDSAQTETALSELQAHFDAAYGDGAVRVSAPVEEIAAEREKLGRVLAVVLFLAAAALFIASINLFNLMLMRVIKRTKNVGISRALGASRAEVFRGFLTESGMMSAAGAAVGLA
ncbi:MAG: ABC transporter permease, partial [Spirochaetota bacterium]